MNTKPMSGREIERKISEHIERRLFQYKYIVLKSVQLRFRRAVSIETYEKPSEADVIIISPDLKRVYIVEIKQQIFTDKLFPQGQKRLTISAAREQINNQSQVLDSILRAYGYFKHSKIELLIYAHTGTNGVIGKDIIDGEVALNEFLAGLTKTPNDPNPEIEKAKREIRSVMDELSTFQDEYQRYQNYREIKRIAIQVTKTYFLRDLEIHIGNGSRLFVTSADMGTGKTFLLTEILQQLRATRKPKGVMVLCHNILLRDALAGRISDANIKTYRSYFGTLMRRAGMPFEDAPEKKYKVLDNVELSRLANHVGETFDLIFVDEAQDFPIEYIEFLKSNCLGESGIMIVFKDEKQNLFRFPEAPHNWRKLNAVDLTPLENNIRNQGHIVSTLQALGYCKNSKTIIPSGKEVRLIPTTAPESDLTAEIQYYLRSFYVPSEILVLTIQSPQSRTGIIGDAGLGKIEWCEYQETARINQLRYSQVAKFKGLESPVVILLIQRPIQEDDLMYIANGIGRAEFRLSIFASKAIVNELSGKIKTGMRIVRAGSEIDL